MKAGRLGLFLLAAGCMAPPPLKESRPPEFTRAEEAYLSQEFSRARMEFERFRQSYPRSSYIPRALYFEGRCLLAEERPILARERFEEARQGFDDPAEKAKARMGIGDAFFMQDRYEEAEDAYLSAKGSGGVPTDEVLYKAALCAQRLGRWRDADQRFTEIVQTYPQGQRHPQAKRAVEEGQGHFFTIQTGTFRVRENADRKAEAMQSAGLETHLREVPSPEGTLYRVCVGKYDDYRDAKEDLDSLRQKGVISEGRIIP